MLRTYSLPGDEWPCKLDQLANLKEFVMDKNFLQQVSLFYFFSRLSDPN